MDVQFKPTSSALPNICQFLSVEDVFKCFGRLSKSHYMFLNSPIQSGLLLQCLFQNHKLTQPIPSNCVTLQFFPRSNSTDLNFEVSINKQLCIYYKPSLGFANQLKSLGSTFDFLNFHPRHHSIALLMQYVSKLFTFSQTFTNLPYDRLIMKTHVPDNLIALLCDDDAIYKTCPKLQFESLHILKNFFLYMSNKSASKKADLAKKLIAGLKKLFHENVKILTQTSSRSDVPVRLEITKLCMKMFDFLVTDHSDCIKNHEINEFFQLVAGYIKKLVATLQKPSFFCSNSNNITCTRGDFVFKNAYQQLLTCLETAATGWVTFTKSCFLSSKLLKNALRTIAHSVQKLLDPHNVWMMFEMNCKLDLVLGLLCEILECVEKRLITQSGGNSFNILTFMQANKIFDGLTHCLQLCVTGKLPYSSIEDNTNLALRCYSIIRQSICSVNTIKQSSRKELDGMLDQYERLISQLIDSNIISSCFGLLQKSEFVDVNDCNIWPVCDIFFILIKVCGVFENNVNVIDKVVNDVCKCGFVRYLTEHLCLKLIKNNCNSYKSDKRSDKVSDDSKENFNNKFERLNAVTSELGECVEFLACVCNFVEGRKCVIDFDDFEIYLSNLTHSWTLKLKSWVAKNQCCLHALVSKSLNNNNNNKEDDSAACECNNKLDEDEVKLMKTIIGHLKNISCIVKSLVCNDDDAEFRPKLHQMEKLTDTCYTLVATINYCVIARLQWKGMDEIELNALYVLANKATSNVKKWFDTYNLLNEVFVHYLHACDAVPAWGAVAAMNQMNVFAREGNKEKMEVVQFLFDNNVLDLFAFLLDKIKNKSDLKSNDEEIDDLKKREEFEDQEDDGKRIEMSIEDKAIVKNISDLMELMSSFNISKDARLQLEQLKNHIDKL